MTDASVVFGEKNGMLAVEAEHFAKQRLTDVRAFYLTTRDTAPNVSPDGDPTHVAGASGGAYLEILPDTRRTHDDRLVHGTNFSPTPGKLAVLEYNIHVQTPGRYYVWVRAFSTGSEDNGLHVGIDGTWPESGQRLQWCDGKNQWRWESKQRTAVNHCGEPHKIFLDITRPGRHTVTFSMREDGFEFDKWIMTTDREFVAPAGVGPRSFVFQGTPPDPSPFVPVKKDYPEHWGDPPLAQTRDLRPLPGGYGRGSSTLARWIQRNLDQDAAARTGAEDPKTPDDRPHRSSPTKPVSASPLFQPRQPDGDGSVVITGELKTWHNVTLSQSGPFAHEQDNTPNPFTDYRMMVTFSHADGPSYVVPGYFAADGAAGNSSAESGTCWRAHFAPDRTGRWTYHITFTAGQLAALNGQEKGTPRPPFDGQTGSFDVAASDKTGRDLRAHGRLEYVGKHYLRFAGSKKYFLKVGADAPETLLGYSEFDNTVAGKPGKVPLKTWKPHVRDWREGDPSWKEGKGKGLVGAINYLANKGCNAFSFLTYNAGGDGDNVWPFIHRDDKLHYDCSKLDQWGMVFEHGTAKGMHLHFKMQETENDDHRLGHQGKAGFVPESLDGGDLGTQRKLYFRELIARFGHNLALNWNLGEENTQSTDQQKAMIDYIADLDPYGHNIVVHTFPDQQDEVYRPLLGTRSRLTGVSLQNSDLKSTHAQACKWVTASSDANRPWVVAFDESGSAAHGQCPDLGYRGFDGHDRTGKMVYTQHRVRKLTLWGTLMAGGAGNEYYFGYQFDENDLVCEDWRSRDQSWDYCRIAIGFFHDHEIPFWDMRSRDELVGNPSHIESKFCFAKENNTYLVYLADGGEADLDLSATTDRFRVRWFDPRLGGALQSGTVTDITGGAVVGLGRPPHDEDEDWLVVVRR